MLLHTLMFWWAVLALVIIIVAGVGVLTRAGSPVSEPKSLFDFSGGQEEGRQM